MRAVSPPLPPEPRDIPRRASVEDEEQHAISQTTIDGTQQPIRDAVNQAVGESVQQKTSNPPINEAFISKLADLVAEKLSNSSAGLKNNSSQPTVEEPTPTTTLLQESESSSPPNVDVNTKVRAGSGQSEGCFSQAVGSDVDVNGFVAPPASQYERSSRAGSGAEQNTESQTARSNIRRAEPVIGSPVEELENMDAVEKTWQILFDKHGNPLPRLGHYLRGLALHIIDDFEPKGTLVVTPVKMLRYFSFRKLDDEDYPWTFIFDQLSPTSLSTLYQKLHAQHHLVQTTNHSAPTVPALTPWGFESFMTCLIQANPDQEFRRIAETVKNMPVNSAEDRSFRFPKEIRRRLLPQMPSTIARQRLTASMPTDLKSKLRNSPVMPPPPPPPSVQQTMPQMSERQRAPYTRKQAVDDEDLVSTSGTMERERKPYVAREGGGKVHHANSEDTQQYRPDDMPPRPVRQSSSTTYTPETRASANRNRHSTGPPISYNNRTSGRRSPPLSNPYSKSDTLIPGDLPLPYHDNAPRGTDYIDDETKRLRRQTISSSDFDPRGKTIPARTAPAHNSFDSGYGSAGFTQQLPPLGTSFPAQRTTQSSYDERRRSTYSAGPDGIDGWQPFASGYSSGPLPPPPPPSQPQQQNYGSETGR